MAFLTEIAAVERVQHGESMTSIAAAFRADLCRVRGIDPRSAKPDVYASEVEDFMRGLCRRFADRHADDRKVGAALLAYVERCHTYEAWDALLTAFRFEGRARYVARGKSMFPGPLTAHWRA